MRRRSSVESYRNSGLILNSLVDIALSLVIAFIVSMPIFFESGIFVSAPGAARAAANEPGSDIKANILITNDGRIMLNEAQVSYENLSELLPRLLQRSVERRVIVAAEEQVKYDRVMQILDLAKQCGAADIALLRTRRTK
ncbi:MAG: biopolymer transporter ExbD [candidate division WOR-3 bacterium]|jgi:biopolymer transport protein ExbD|nr:biopolymer transporter ExbD [candidate division WOR-3 bacterium]MCR4423058.1 biopolymer transporter ExbD [candidate division WOR-3 bacterium]MDH7518397.1 biopolymer transporter ExbD [bacterium]